MKQIRTFVIGVASCILAFASTSQVSAQSATDGIAKVVAVSGHARYFIAGDSTPHDVKTGLILKSGITIQTASGPNNWVDVILNNAHAVAPPSPTPSDVAHFQPKADQDGIRIFDNTVLSVDKLTITATGADTVTDTELDLKAGSILGTVKKLAPASKYEVKIPNGVAGIRGTIYFLSASGIIRVLTGSVVVAYVGPGGNVITQVVNGGEQFDINTGLVTPIPTPILTDLIRSALAFRQVLLVSPVTYIAPDHRIHFVSPTGGLHGDFDHDGDHDHGHTEGGGPGDTDGD
jgi:hypothetical protein